MAQALRSKIPMDRPPSSFILPSRFGTDSKHGGSNQSVPQLRSNKEGTCSRGRPSCNTRKIKRIMIIVYGYDDILGELNEVIVFPHVQGRAGSRGVQNDDQKGGLGLALGINIISMSISHGTCMLVRWYTVFPSKF